MLRGLIGNMRKRFSSNLGAGLKVSFWPTALIGIVVIKAVLALGVKPGSFLLSYSGISFSFYCLWQPVSLSAMETGTPQERGHSGSSSRLRTVSGR